MSASLVELNETREAAWAEGDDERKAPEADAEVRTAFDKKVWPELEKAITEASKSGLELDVTALRARIASNAPDSWHLDARSDYAQSSGSGNQPVTLTPAPAVLTEADIEEAAVRHNSSLAPSGKAEYQ